MVLPSWQAATGSSQEERHGGASVQSLHPCSSSTSHPGLLFQLPVGRAGPTLSSGAKCQPNSSKALSPRLSARNRRPQSPGSGRWAATSWPALSSQHQAHPAHPQEAQRANVQVRVVSQTPSPQGKDCSRNILSTCACFFPPAQWLRAHALELDSLG